MIWIWHLSKSKSLPWYSSKPKISLAPFQNNLFGPDILPNQRLGPGILHKRKWFGSGIFPNYCNGPDILPKQDLALASFQSTNLALKSFQIKLWPWHPSKSMSWPMHSSNSKIWPCILPNQRSGPIHHQISERHYSRNIIFESLSSSALPTGTHTCSTILDSYHKIKCANNLLSLPISVFPSARLSNRHHKFHFSLLIMWS